MSAARAEGVGEEGDEGDRADVVDPFPSSTLGHPNDLLNRNRNRNHNRNHSAGPSPYSADAS